MWAMGEHIDSVICAHFGCICCVLAADAEGRAKLRLVFGLDDAKRALADGPAADARFHTPHSLLLRTDSAGQPFVLVSDSACIRILRGKTIGGEGDDRVETLGGPEILKFALDVLRINKLRGQPHVAAARTRSQANAALPPALRALTHLDLDVELQTLDGSRVLVQNRITGDKNTTCHHFTLDATNLEQPQLLPIVSNLKPDLPLKLTPFLHNIPKEEFANVRMLAPNLWLHVAYERNNMIESHAFPYFPDERRVDQTNRDGVEAMLTDADDDEVDEVAEDLTVVADNRVVISYWSHVVQADVEPKFGESGTDQRLPVAPRFSEQQGVEGLAAF